MLASFPLQVCGGRRSKNKALLELSTEAGRKDKGLILRLQAFKANCSDVWAFRGSVHVRLFTQTYNAGRRGRKTQRTLAKCQARLDQPSSQMSPRQGGAEAELHFSADL